MTDSSIPTAGVVLERAAAVYDTFEPLCMFFQHWRVQRAMLAALELRGTEQVLDVGCGTGLLTAAVAAQLSPGQVTGIDASGAMIRLARRKRATDNCHFRVAAGEALPWPENSFDAAVSSMFFHHVDQELKRACLNELRRVVRPGGRLVVADLDTPWNLFGRLYGWGGYRLFRQDQIRENLTGAMPRLFSETGWAGMRSRLQVLGCVRVWEGVKP